MEQLKIINFMLYANMRMEARLLLLKLPKGVESVTKLKLGGKCFQYPDTYCVWKIKST